MSKLNFLKYVIFPLMIAIPFGCSEAPQTPKLTGDHMLEIVQYYSFNHLQSDFEIEILKSNKIRSVTVIEENIENSGLDSLTFLRINGDGRIISKTTNECTTIGCLPYTILQSYDYLDGKIIRMNDYTFKHKYKSRRAYWKINDTLKLSLFDWEDYSYVDDTIKIESATQKWKITKDESNRIISWELNIKMNNQAAKIVCEYTSGSIIEYLTNTSVKEPIVAKAKVIAPNKVEKSILKSQKQISKIVYIFNRIGLLDKIIIYKNEDLVKIRKFKYDKRV